MENTTENPEIHPVAYSALAWVKEQPIENLLHWQEAFASCSIENDATANVCLETMRRLLAGEPIGAQHILGLAYVMRSLEWSDEESDRTIRMDPRMNWRCSERESGD